MTSTLSAEDIGNVLFDTMCHLGLSLEIEVFKYTYVLLAQEEGWNPNEGCPISCAEATYYIYRREGKLAEAVYEFCLTVLAAPRVLKEDVEYHKGLVKYYTACQYAEVEPE